VGGTFDGPAPTAEHAVVLQPLVIGPKCNKKDGLGDGTGPISWGLG